MYHVRTVYEGTVTAETLYALFELPFLGSLGSAVGKDDIALLGDVAASARVRIRQQANVKNYVWSPEWL